MNLDNRNQEPNQTLMEFTMEIDQMAHLDYRESFGEFLEIEKIQRFIGGIMGICFDSQEEECKEQTAKQNQPKK